MRAIFLDIDGVICCNNFGRLEDRKLQLLRQVVQQTGAKIVLSTDWRRVPKLKSQLIQTLRDYGMEVIGSTPMRPPWQPIRPQEIIEWLTAYNASASGGGTQEIIDMFVAVDDRPLLQESGGEKLRGRFVHTRNMSGLTEKCAQRMVQLLMHEERDAAPIPGLVGGASPHGQRQPPSPMQVAGGAAGTPALNSPERRGTIGVAPMAVVPNSPPPAAAPHTTPKAVRSPPRSPPHTSNGGFGVPAPLGSAPTDPPASGGMFMSPVQRSIFRGSHDASRSAVSPVTAAAPRGYTAAGARHPPSASMASPSSPFPTLGASSFADGGRRVPVRQAVASRTAAVRSQTAAIGAGRSGGSPGFPSAMQRPANFLVGGHGAMASHLRPSGVRNPLF